MTRYIDRSGRARRLKIADLDIADLQPRDGGGFFRALPQRLPARLVQRHPRKGAIENTRFQGGP
jgi:hypothetical protein